MKDNLKGIEQLVVSDAITQRINQYLHDQDFTIDDLIGDIVIIKFNDGLVNIDIFYNEDEDQYEMKASKLANGSIIEQGDQRLHYLEYKGNISPTI